MTLFEFTFGLQAIILGLALTHLVVSLNRLILARERVTWAVQPLLATALVVIAVLLYWTQSWARQADSTTLGAIMLNVAVNLLIFAAAAAVLPEDVPEGRVTDIGAHFERHRRYFFSLYALPILALGVVRPLAQQIGRGQFDSFENWPNLVTLAAVAVCMTVRRRWVNIVVLSLLLVWMVASIAGYQLTTRG